jgi:diacylglycerol kinase (ATP)
MTRCVQIVCNPTSGSYAAARIEALTAAWVRAGYTTLVTESSPKHSFALNAAAKLLCVAGGDGTVRHVVAEIISNQHVPPLCVFPMGTINLIARELDYPHQPDAFVSRVLQGIVLGLVPARLNDTLFMVCASIGPDSLAVASVSDSLKRRIGRLAYGAALLRLVFTWPRPRLSVMTPDQSFDCEAIYIAKGRYFAGPWSFAPYARMEDPLQHVVALRTARRRDFLAFMVSLVLRRVDRLENVIHITCTELEINSNQNWPVQADGDLVDQLPVSLGISADRIKLQ